MYKFIFKIIFKNRNKIKKIDSKLVYQNKFKLSLLEFHTKTIRIIIKFITY